MIPEELMFNITEFSGEAFPGLTEEYILQEIGNATVHFEDIEDRARDVGLPHLLTYLTEVDYLQVFRNIAHRRKQAREQHRYDWSNFIDVLDRMRNNMVIVNRGATHTIRVVLGLFTDRQGSVDRYDDSIPQSPNIRTDMDNMLLPTYNVELPRELMKEFNQQVFLKRCLGDPMNLSSVIFNHTNDDNLIQHELYDYITYSTSDYRLNATELMEVLRYQRRKRDLIQSVLHSGPSGITTPIRIDRHSLDLMEYMLAHDIRITSEATASACCTLNVQCKKECLQSFCDKLLNVSKHDIVHVGTSYHDISIELDEPEETGFNILQRHTYKYSDIRAVLGYVQLIHNPIITSRLIEIN